MIDAATMASGRQYAVNPQAVGFLNAQLEQGVPLSMCASVSRGLIYHLEATGAIRWDHYRGVYPQAVRDAFFGDRAVLRSLLDDVPMEAPALEQTVDWNAIIDAAPRKGWWQWVEERGLDPNEFKRRRDARRKES